MTEREMQCWSMLRKRIRDLASAGAPDFCPCGNVYFPYGPDEREREDLASKIFRVALEVAQAANAVRGVIGLEVAQAANAVRGVIDDDDLGGDEC